MGSLMAGWDSPFHDPRAVKLERNKSLTKEEIESYWRSKRKDGEQHLQTLSNIVLKSSEESTVKEPEPEKKHRRSSSLTLTTNKGALLELETDLNLEKLVQQKGWWTRSNSAFLNEPPVIALDGPTYKYASQFHVAKIARSNAHSRDGISA